MSIIIEGAEMPPSCYFCPLTNDGFYLCKANNPYRQLEDDCEERRPEWCPIVTVPPHGRLGDLDKLEQMFVDIDNAPYSSFDGLEPFYSAEDAAKIIRLAPTVIPASKEET